MSIKEKISQINPVVNEQGSVIVRAEIQGEDGLYNGMNVNIEVCQ